MEKLPLKAMYVEASTTGLTIGAASIYAIAICGGTPLFINRLTIGTTPHSQVGRMNPVPIPNASPPTIFLGTILKIRSVDTNTSIVEEINAPTTRKGMASIKIESAMAEKSWNDSYISFGSFTKHAINIAYFLGRSP
jgi:hypothetical protein